MPNNNELSKEARTLLKEVLNNLTENNIPTDGYWEQRFDELGTAEQSELFSLFDELQEAKCLSYLSADNYPYTIILTNRGLNFFGGENEHMSENKMGIGAVLQTAFSDYTVEAVLGQGANGIVYKCRDTDNSEVAIKVINRNEADKKRIKRFKNEIYFCIHASHDNIIKILDYGTYQADDAVYLFYVMPLYPYTLRSKMREGIEPAKALTYFQWLLAGLEYAHLQRVVHRDIKPENILIDDKSDTVVLCDFGIAHFDEEKKVTYVKTDKADRLANFQYASPEQKVKGNAENVDGRSDVYSLSLILNELFTGEVPAGTKYRKIGDAYPNFAFLDVLFEQMNCQSPSDRVFPVGDIITMLNALMREAERTQNIERLQKTVPTESEFTALEVDVKDAVFSNNTLTFTLTDSVPKRWGEILVSENYGFCSTSAILPRNAIVIGDKISFAVKNGCAENQIADTVKFFKEWMKQTTAIYNAKKKSELEEKKRREEERILKAIAQNNKEISINNKLKELL